MKKVVILGGGFAGLNAARKLAGVHDIEVTVIDRENHHLFQPLLYQVAMAALAALSPADIAAPIRSLLNSANTRIIKASVQRIDVAEKHVITDAGGFVYDYLLVACGAQHAYFGHEEWEPYAPGLKTLSQATEIRRRVLEAFEAAEREVDAQVRRRHLTFVVVGGGPTGVELAGAIGEMSLAGKAREPFHYFDMGQLATIGRSRAVCEIFGVRLTGFIAWWVWLLVHIYRLSGFRNRLIVLIQWAWSYLTFTRGARLIVGKEWRAYGEPNQ